MSCQVAYHTYKSCSRLWEKFLCPKVKGHEWFNLKCLTGSCVKCGVQLLPACNKELDPKNTTLVAWKRFEKVLVRKTKHGEDKFVTTLERKMPSPRIMQLPKFRNLSCIIFWRNGMIENSRLVKEKLKEDEIISLIDFSKNYSFKTQNEVHEQYWYNFQLSILVHITYRVNPKYDPSDSKSLRLNINYYYYISDDRRHEICVQHCLNLHWQCFNITGVLSKTPCSLERWLCKPI